jgi:hypothetical protein
MLIKNPKKPLALEPGDLMGYAGNAALADCAGVFRLTLQLEKVS